MRVFEVVNTMSEKLEDLIEGSPTLPGLMNDPTFSNQMESMVRKYSRLCPEVTPHFEGSTGEFLKFIIQIFPKSQVDLKLAERAVQNAIEDFYRRNTGETVSSVVISDPISDGGYNIKAYFGYTPKQNRKLADWFKRLAKDDYARAIRQFQGLKDKELQKELNEL